MQLKEISQIIKQVTGNIGRKEGIFYKKNEVFMDVIENCNMLLSPKGAILSANVQGRVVMKAFLSGMPQCRIGLNDKLGDTSETQNKKFKAIDIDDVQFHQCVQLQKFDHDKSISFIPPDGEFELMKYRVQNSILAPFKLLAPIVREIGKTKVEIRLQIKSIFNSRLYGKNVIVIIPVPPNTAKCNTRVSAGKAYYNAKVSAIEWTIKRFPGGSDYSISSEVELIAKTVEKKKWDKPPIQLKFQVPMYTASGLHVRFLRVIEQSKDYQTTKWVRYLTQNGIYENRY